MYLLRTCVSLSCCSSLMKLGVSGPTPISFHDWPGRMKCCSFSFRSKKYFTFSVFFWNFLYVLLCCSNYDTVIVVSF